MLSRSLARSLAGKLGRGLAPGAGAIDPDPILLELGANLLHWWEPRESTVTPNGSNISAIANLVSGGPSLSEGTPANQPLWVNDGSGPNGQPFIRLQDTGRRLAATISTLAAGHYTAMYAVLAANSGDNAQRNTARLVRSSDGALAMGFLHQNGGASEFHRCFATFTGGSQDITPITDPAHTTDWLLEGARLLDSGSHLLQINGSTTTPSLSGNAGLIEVDTVVVGREAGASSSGGDLAFLALTTQATSATDEIVKSYVTARFGIALA